MPGAVPSSTGADRRRIGLFGGTFDPPHIGHLVAALEVRDRLHLDEVILMVANDPWQKRSRTVTPAPIRLEMTRAAVADVDGLAAGDQEIRRGGRTYTVDTVAELSGGASVIVIVGADAAAGLDSWHRAQDLAAAAEFAVVSRPGAAFPAIDPMWVVERVDVPGIDLSSTEVRRRTADGRTIQVLVPPGVRAVIERESLYRLGT